MSKIPNMPIFENAIVKRFLRMKKEETGSKSMEQYVGHIKMFFTFCGKDDPLEVERINVMDFRDHLESQNYTLKTKESKLGCLRGFFEYVNFMKPGFVNPVPKIKFMKLSKDKMIMSVEDKEKNQRQKWFDYDQLKEILNHARDYNYEIYMQLVIQVFTGCRIGEVVTLKKDNVKPFRNFLMTGIVENARKTSKEDPIYFVFSKRIGLILSRYMMYHKNKYGDQTEWLFPSLMDYQKHSSVRRIQTFLKKASEDLGYPIKSHAFRRNISTHRAKESKTSLEHREFLSNHKISSTEANHYTQISIEQRYEIYMENYPATYIKLESVIPY
ncbi:MAG: hypothetical protein EU530_11525 [Promethearchaeota archaeon]|nr:MAG: hypothetical protein EU530_11525 [Candidatus Lokiarchaeota archaeon]